MFYNKGGGQFKQTNTGENPALRQAASGNFFGGTSKVVVPVSSPITLSSNSKGNLE